MIESCVHGRERREQRDIDKYDLEYCVKYGTREPGFRDPKTGAPRWKYTFAGVTFVTDETSTKEVTSWAEELPLLPRKRLEARSQDQYEEMKRRLANVPKLATSHCVIVIDMLGSMKTSDIYGHKTRSRGVYYSLAEDFIAKTLMLEKQNPISLTDVVTLIEMRSTPKVVFEKESWSWQLTTNSWIYQSVIRRGITATTSTASTLLCSTCTSPACLVIGVPYPSSSSRMGNRVTSQ